MLETIYLALSSESDAALAAAKTADIPIPFWETPHYTASPEQYAYLENRSRPGGAKVCFVPTPLGMVEGPKQTQSHHAKAAQPTLP